LDLGGARRRHQRRVGVVEVGHELDGGVADGGDGLEGFFEGIFF